MRDVLTKALVLTILRHAEDFPWRMQEIGLLALRLDAHREHRLHVWDPAYGNGDPPVHDHPYDFTSTIVAGELTDTLYVEDPVGDRYTRFRYVPGAEERRRADTVTLSGVATTFVEGDEYRHAADELHTSSQRPGTVTAIRCRWVAPTALTVCTRDGSWPSSRARDATRAEIKDIVANALEWF